MNSDVVLDCVPLSLCPICLSKLYYALIKENKYRNTFELQIPTEHDDKKDEPEEIIMGGTADERQRRKWGKKQIDDNVQFETTIQIIGHVLPGSQLLSRG